jgi:hypothetical protein
VRPDLRAAQAGTAGLADLQATQALGIMSAEAVVVAVPVLVVAAVVVEPVAQTT